MQGIESKHRNEVIKVCNEKEELLRFQININRELSLSKEQLTESLYRNKEQAFQLSRKEDEIIALKEESNKIVISIHDARLKSNLLIEQLQNKGKEANSQIKDLNVLLMRQKEEGFNQNEKIKNLTIEKECALLQISKTESEIKALMAKNADVENMLSQEKVQNAINNEKNEKHIESLIEELNHANLYQKHILMNKKGSSTLASKLKRKELNKTLIL